MKYFDAQTVAARRARLARAFEQDLPAGAVALFFAGQPIQKPGGLDQMYPFIPHPEFLWLTGSRRAGGVVAYAHDLGWIDFVEPVSDAEKLWEGTTEQVEGQDVAGLETWLRNRKFSAVFALGQAPAKDAWSKDERLQLRVQKSVNAVRRVKDAAEAALVRRCADAANAGYRRLREVLRPGLSERELQLEYETAVLRAGSEKFPYDTIVGAGTNAAILHAIPTERKVGNGELVLVDAGADIGDYCVDITRVFCAGGKWSTQQAALYDLVLKAQLAGIAKCRPGTPWPEVHLTCATIMAEGLRELGILKGAALDALERGAISVFFPHGVGHMVGLRVRDVGEDPDRAPTYVGGSRLRVGLTLQEGHLMTVEPGLYFVKALVESAEIRAKYDDVIDWNEVEKWKNLGGVRIEDDILVTAGAPDNLTAVVSKAR